MKFGPAEGTPEEIKGFMENLGLDAQMFFQPADKPITRVWFVIPAVVVLAAFAGLVFPPVASQKAALFIFLIGCGAGTWLAVNVQLRFENVWASGGLIFVIVLLLLVGLGVLLPSQLLEEAIKWKS